ncbi:MAG: hypothetical protein ACP5E5_13585 [Acidobacteriaceae bacterium]
MAGSAPDKVVTEQPPASIPWETFLSALDAWKAHGIPAAGNLEHSLGQTPSPATQQQLVSALRFLGLLDNRNHPLPALSALVAAAPEDRKRLLTAILQEKYATILSHDLASISPGQLEAELRSFGVSGPTLLGAIRFFVRACQAAGIAISKQLSPEPPNPATAQHNPAPADSRAADTPDAGIKITDSKADAQSHAEALSPALPPRTCRWEEKLLRPFPQFDPTWSEETKAQWLAEFRQRADSAPDDLTPEK